MPSSYYNTQNSYTVVDEGTYRSYTDDSASYTYYERPSYYNYYDSYDSGYDYWGNRKEEVHHHHHHHNSKPNTYTTHHYSSPSYNNGSNDTVGGLIFVGVCVAGVLFVCYLINEDNKRKAEREAARKEKVQRIASDPKMQERFTHEPLSVYGAPADPEFGIATANSVSLKRVVEVYQWSETCRTIEKRVGNQVKRGKAYDYKSEWNTNFKNSSNFADPNYRVNIAPNK